MKVYVYSGTFEFITDTLIDKQLLLDKVLNGLEDHLLDKVSPKAVAIRVGFTGIMQKDLTYEDREGSDKRVSVDDTE